MDFFSIPLPPFVISLTHGFKCQVDSLETSDIPSFLPVKIAISKLPPNAIYIYANSQIRISIPWPLLELQNHLSNSLLDTSTWMSNKHLQINPGSSEQQSSLPARFAALPVFPSQLRTISLFQLYRPQILSSSLLPLFLSNATEVSLLALTLLLTSPLLSYWRCSLD